MVCVISESFMGMDGGSSSLWRAMDTTWTFQLNLARPQDFLEEGNGRRRKKKVMSRCQRVDRSASDGRSNGYRRAGELTEPSLLYISARSPKPMQGWCVIEKGEYAVSYLVRRTGQPAATRVFSNEKEVGRILRSSKDSSYVLRDSEGRLWSLHPMLRGEVRPFSLAVARAEVVGGVAEGSDETVLTIKDHLFHHNGRFYTFTGLPEGTSLRDLLIGKRYICRLDTFPFTSLYEIDAETIARLRRFRGVPVGEIRGLGSEGYTVSLSIELESIGLLLAAASYILYSTA
jgi:hypothetical protein